MTALFLRVSFFSARVGWRHFSQDPVPDVGSWMELEGLILNACLAIHLDPQYDGPTEFRVVGRRGKLHRMPYEPKPRNIMTLDVVLTPNPSAPFITVKYRGLDPSLRSMEDDLDYLQFGRDRTVRRYDAVPKWAREETFNPFKAARARPEPYPLSLQYAPSERSPRIDSENPYRKPMQA